ncbi:hypothetical protein [Thiomicrorhabdus aquaedulcis]|uniref:hypothetical protein n=1 Tax=Thiomicrorhabdus aquaedulcis TaxID=2211106 RepID=UPI0015622E3A|nr:hypothetical protein [Thiomicrorhabdus aquaedulcis]
MTEQKSNEMQRLPLIPKELHSEFKMVCVAKNISMQQASEKAIENWVRENKNSVTNA